MSLSPVTLALAKSYADSVAGGGSFHAVIIPTGTPATDTAAIQAALDAGGDIFIDGDVTINATLTMTVDRTRLNGNGTITATGLTNVPMLRLLNVDYCYVGSGLFWDGEWAGGLVGIELCGTLLSEIYFKGDRLPLGMDLVCTTASGATQNTALNSLSFVLRNGVNGARFTGQSGRHVANNQFTRFDYWGAASVAGVGLDFVAYADNNYFAKGYVFVQHADGIGMVINSGDPTNDVEVYENHFDLIIEGTAGKAIDGNRSWGSIGEWTTYGVLRLSGSLDSTDLDIAATCDLRLVRSNTNGEAVADYSFNAPDRRIVGAGKMSGAGGSPGLNNINRHGVYLLDASSDEWVTTDVDVPKEWQKANLKLRYINAGAGSGDIVWLGHIDKANSASDSVSSPTGGSATTVTASAQNAIDEVTLQTNVDLSGHDGLVTVAIQRDADNAADTLANDAGVVCIILERVL